jgi:hypothetical protein
MIAALAPDQSRFPEWLIRSRAEAARREAARCALAEPPDLAAYDAVLAALKTWPIGMQRRWIRRCEELDAEAPGQDPREVMVCVYSELQAELPVPRGDAYEDAAAEDPGLDFGGPGVTAADLAGEPELPRPPGPPAWGLTRKGRVVLLADRRPEDEQKDPVVKVTEEGWPRWFPVQDEAGRDDISNPEEP